eukprot:NODE_9313_length_374_cov_23.735385_g8410_i0.p2 GENE.NODE_9313_length_374_cov_23.735385_g8410_i0~~NODE_9313_length_374_cov_23.735385_g8410_i0.p2  ORF type:complete len:70 (+),score=12.42 NODE_9313_length_374_cov_23.735385_g8410_i0:61-270(+)
MATVVIGTLFFVIAGGLGLVASLKCGEMAGLARFIAVTAALCCWSAWIIVYMMQMNPLVIPQRKVSIYE